MPVCRAIPTSPGLDGDWWSASCRISPRSYCFFIRGELYVDSCNEGERGNLRGGTFTGLTVFFTLLRSS